MKKLRLEDLAVESFATATGRGGSLGTVRANEGTVYDCFGSEYGTCANHQHTCAIAETCNWGTSCRETDCVTACQGGGNISLAQSCYANCGNDEIE